MANLGKDFTNYAIIKLLDVKIEKSNDMQYNLILKYELSNKVRVIHRTYTIPLFINTDRVPKIETELYLFGRDGVTADIGFGDINCYGHEVEIIKEVVHTESMKLTHEELNKMFGCNVEIV